MWVIITRTCRGSKTQLQGGKKINLNLYSAGIDFSRQNLTSIDVMVVDP